MNLPRLFVLGDSISMHYGPHLQKMIAGLFAYARKGDPTKVPTDIENPGDANGGDSSRCLDYLRLWQRSGGLPAEVLLLNCGLHDVVRREPDRQLQVPIEAYQQNLRNIIALVRAMGLKLLWVRTTPVCEPHHNKPGDAVWRYQADVDHYNAAADAIMVDADMPMIDLHGLTLVLGDMAKQCPDGRHFVETTRQAQAAFIAGSLGQWAANGLQ